ncbi:MAG TPA: hypothetical protein VIR98_00835, partial [Candidatus Paceibacterota bacterium]
PDSAQGIRMSAFGPLRFGANTNTGYSSASFSEYMRITPTGNVGIGTTSPSQKLEVYQGNIQLDNNFSLKGRLTNGSSVNLLRYNTGNQAVFGANSEILLSGSVQIFPPTGGNIEIRGGATDSSTAVGTVLNTLNTLSTAGSKIVSFKNGSVEKASIGYDGGALFSGNVGIGTSSPYAKFSIAQSSTTPAFVVGVAGSSSPSFIVDSANANGYVGIGTSSPSAKLAIKGNNTFFYGRAFAISDSSNQEKFTVLDNGYVGLGKSNPGFQLDTSSTIRVGGSAASFAPDGEGIELSYTQGTVPHRGNIVAYSRNYNALQDLSLNFAALFVTGSSSYVGIGGTTSPYARFSVEQGSESNVFAVADEGSSTPSFIVKGNGNVGVGVSDPAARLTIATTTGSDVAFKISDPTNTKNFFVVNAVANNSTFVGINAGHAATGASGSSFFGASAGYGATNALGSNFFGSGAGYEATGASNSNFFGVSAGGSASGALNANFFGLNAGYTATNAVASNFFGASAGYGATNASTANFFGASAGYGATNAANSNFLGTSAGFNAANATHSIFIGYQAGVNDAVDNTSSGTSILIGDNTSTGGFSNSIAIGRGTKNSATQQLNLGNVLFATGIYNSDTSSDTALTSGKVGIGTSTPWKALSVEGDASVNNLIPNGPYTTNLSGYDLGSTTSRWNALWAGTVNIGTSTWSIKADSSSNLGVYDAASGGGTKRLTVSANGLDVAGKVGIGMSASSMLDVFAGTPTIMRVGTAGSTYFASGVDTTLIEASGTFTVGSSNNIYGVKSLPTASNLGGSYAANNYAFYGNPVNGAVKWGVYLTGENKNYFSGDVGIGTTSPVSTLSVQGSLCVRDTGSCGTTAGTIYATTASITDIDLAENYPTLDDTLSAGEIVALDTTASTTVKRAALGDKVIGIVSTAPGLLLGKENLNSKPIALSGRVPVKVNGQGGAIAIGDRITLSSTAGVGRKARGSEDTVGIALEAWSGAADDTGSINVFVSSKQKIDFSSFAVDDSGNVGIGTTTPTYKLQVMGDVAATSFVNISTRTAKKDISYLGEEEKSSILDKIRSIGVATYHYNAETDAAPMRLGLIAEEAPTEVLAADGKGVDVYKFSTFILAGVQVLDEKVQSLVDAVASTTAAIADLRVAVATIQTSMANNVATAASSTTAWTDTMGSGMLSFLANAGLRLEQGIAYVADMVADKFSAKLAYVQKAVIDDATVGALEVGSSDKRSGITLYDELNGQPYCLKVVNGEMETRQGSCSGQVSTEVTASSGTPSEPETQPEPLPGETVGAGNVNEETAATSTPATSTTATSTPVVEPVEEETPVIADDSATSTPATSTTALVTPTDETATSTAATSTPVVTSTPEETATSTLVETASSAPTDTASSSEPVAVAE